MLRRLNLTSTATASSRPAKRRRSDPNGDEEDEDYDGFNSEDSSTLIDPSSPVVVFAPGAGSSSYSDWMIRWKNFLGEGLNAVDVVTFDYPYISGGRSKAPPKAENFVESHSEIVKRTMARYPNHPLILVGKSMGSRVSCMVANNKDIKVSAIVCLGYPLKGTNGALRDEILLQLTVPVMFVQGSKDGLCPLEQLEAVCAKMKSPNELHVIEGADHSLKIGKKHLLFNGSTQDDAEREAVRAITTFVSKSLQDSSRKTKGRGMTCLTEIWRLPPDVKIIVKFNDAFQPVGYEGGVYNRFIGTMAKKEDLLPINYYDWRHVPTNLKDKCWRIIEEKFFIPEGHARYKIKHEMIKSLGDKWRNWKCSLKAKYFDPKKSLMRIVANAPRFVNSDQFADIVSFWFSNEGMERSVKNKEIRKRQKSTHTGGTKGYARHAYEMEQESGLPTNRAKLYVKFHKKKDGTALDETSNINIQKMEQLMALGASNSGGSSKVGVGNISWSSDDVYSQVMGQERNGRVRGIGFGPTPGSLSKCCHCSSQISKEDRRVDQETLSLLADELESQKNLLQNQSNQLEKQALELSAVKQQLSLLLSQSTSRNRNVGRDSPLQRRKSSSESVCWTTESDEDD